MSADYITMTIPKQKRIALIAHDAKKEELIRWCEDNRNILSQHELCGTGTTARMITDRTNLQVKGYNSGPLGGDQQIGAKIVEGRIDFVVFFSDPLTAKTTRSGCEGSAPYRSGVRHTDGEQQSHSGLMIQSKLMDEPYDHKVINFQKNIDNRANTLGK